MNGIDIHGAWDDSGSCDECDCAIPCESQVSFPRTTPIVFKKIRYYKRSVSTRQKKEIAYRQQYRCWFCNMLLLPSWQVDHFIPLWQGGSNASSNLVACCGNCHNEKTAIENDRRSPYFKQHHSNEKTNKNKIQKLKKIKPLHA